MACNPESDAEMSMVDDALEQGISSLNPFGDALAMSSDDPIVQSREEFLTVLERLNAKWHEETNGVPESSEDKALNMETLQQVLESVGDRCNVRGDACVLEVFCARPQTINGVCAVFAQEGLAEFFPINGFEGTSESNRTGRITRRYFVAFKSESDAAVVARQHSEFKRYGFRLAYPTKDCDFVFNHSAPSP
jgi:hypothetical protein